MAITIDVPSKVDTTKALHAMEGTIYSPVGEDRYLLPINIKESDKGVQLLLNRSISERTIPFYCLESYGIELFDADTDMYIQMEDATITPA